MTRSAWWIGPSAAIVLVASLACGGAAAPADYAPLAGYWRGYDWGTVTFTEDRGTYSDTFSGKPGSLHVWSTGPRSYEGTWREDDARHGTLTFTVSVDGESINGTYLPDPGCTIGKLDQGPVRWKR